jgi:hypothetical protein
MGTFAGKKSHIFKRGEEEETDFETLKDMIAPDVVMLAFTDERDRKMSRT